MASKPDKGAENDIEDDFVVLETFEGNDMTDSTKSSASTIPEKQAFESLEKQSASLEDSSIDEKPKCSDSYVTLGESDSGSFSSLGSSTINEKPYYESSRVIDKQFALERKLGVFGEGSGEEKMDETCGEKDHGQGEGRGDNVEEDSGRQQGDDICSGEGGEGRVRSDKKQEVGGMTGRDDVKGDGSEAKADLVKEGVGEGRVRGGSKVARLDTGGSEGSWTSVEGKKVVGKGEVKDGEGGNGEVEDEGEVVEDNEVKMDVECTKEPGHVEDIPSCEQTEISKEHSNAEPETPGNADTQLQEGG